MHMKYLLLVIEPRSAFATPLKGDTLFGQLCWALRDRFGEDHIGELLQGYTKGRPFAVVSDALPARCLPRPVLPSVLFGDIDPRERKATKKRAWLRQSDFDRPMGEWLGCMVEDPDQAGHGRDAVGSARTLHGPLAKQETRFRNSIDRRSGTTTGGGFAPYGVEQFWYRHGTRLHCHIVYNADRIDADALQRAMTDVGRFGFGRDATVGLGRFTVTRREGDGQGALPVSQDDATSWLTLAPVAPQGLGWKPERCWYRPFTRFGRHGNAAAHLGNPFKAPVLLADTGAVLTPQNGYVPWPFVGQGLGGSSQPISRSIPATVHQGYAPVIGIHVPEVAGSEEDPA